MKLLHIIQRYYPYIGGSELYFQEISERLVREGHRVTVYTTDAWDLEHFWSRGKRTIDTRRENHNGVAIERFPVQHLPVSPLTFPALRHSMSFLGQLPFNTAPLLFFLTRYNPYIPALERALEASQKDFDLVHVANISLDSMVYAAFRLARRQHIPLVVTPFIHLGEPHDTWVRRFYTMPHQLEMLKNADAVIVMTERERTALIERGVTPEQVCRIPVGIDPHALSGGDAARFRAKHRIENPIVVFLGAAAFDKGAMHLVQAMQQVWQTHAATLVMAGPQLSAFERFFAQQSDETKRRTRVLGFISEQEKRDLLAACSVLALPSRTDTFGIVFLEAWLYDKPVIGAWAGGIPDVIDDGRDGFLVKFGDTPTLAARITQLLDDRSLAQQMGEAGHAKVLRELTWERTFVGVRGVYERLKIKD